MTEPHQNAGVGYEYRLAGEDSNLMKGMRYTAEKSPGFS